MMLNEISQLLPAISRFSVYFVPIVMALASIYAYHEINMPSQTHGFVLEYEQHFPEYDFTAYLYKHKTYNCPFLYIKTKDQHNFFSTSFRTTNTDDSGISHILEHLVLQGSEKYPVRSIFNEMRKRSFATFMNGFTSIEWTSFPFSTTNSKDYFNLLDIYLDSTFHPSLTEEIFKSECHHLEFEIPNNSSSSLRHTGVVYNEMIGEQSRPANRFSNLIRRNLYDDSVLGLNYGGDPQKISRLTLESVKEYHKKYYHPSNAIFFHYGSIPVSEVMKKVNYVISSFSNKYKQPKDASIEQPKWLNPRQVEVEGPIVGDPNKILSGIVWMVGDLSNYSDIFDLHFLSELLMDSTSSPLFKGLIKNEIGTNFIHSGFMSVVKQPYFSIALEGVDKNKSFIGKSVLAILNQVFTDNFERKRIDSVLHNLEMQDKLTDSNRGLKIWKNVISSWIHRVNPIDIIDNKWEIERIRSVLALQPRYFELLLKQKLITNSHRLEISMKGVPNFQENYNKKIKSELTNLKNEMTNDDKNKIISETQKLKNMSENVNNVQKLPNLQISDIPTKAEEIKYVNNQKVTYFNTQTNGIAFVTIKSDIPIETENISDLKLLDLVLTDVGADDLDEDQFADEVYLYTGGFDSSLTLNTDCKTGLLHCHFSLTSSCLVKDFDKMLSLFKKTITNPRIFNNSRIELLMEMTKTNYKNRISQNGNFFSLSFAAQEISKEAKLNELWNGISFYKKLDKITDFVNLSKYIESLHKNVFMSGTFTASLHCQESHSSSLIPKLNSLISEISPVQPKKVPNSVTFTGEVTNTILETDSSTYFTSIVTKGPKYTDLENCVKRSFFCLLLSSEILTRKVREELGSYGVSAKHDFNSGITSISSYRDTCPKQVLESFMKSISYCSEYCDIDMIKRMQIRYFSILDSPISPQEYGQSIFYGISNNEIRQKIRELVLNMNVDQITNEAKNLMKANWSSAILGSASLAPLPQKYTNVKL